MERTMNDELQPAQATEADLRKHAIDSLHRKAAFKKSAALYVAVNLLLIVIWALAADDGDGFWPIWVIGGWGIGLAIQGWAAYGWTSRGITEDDVNAEIERLKR
ncbi:MAG: 2TM domain-containing protein [Solirubrobacterales bacterium]|nr:2TM domain-containing protein [Solirubrobacterales bacterium]